MLAGLKHERVLAIRTPLWVDDEIDSESAGARSKKQPPNIGKLLGARARQQ
jgi:hypothetical protein